MQQSRLLKPRYLSDGEGQKVTLREVGDIWNSDDQYDITNAYYLGIAEPLNCPEQIKVQVVMPFSIPDPKVHNKLIALELGDVTTLSKEVAIKLICELKARATDPNFWHPKMELKKPNKVRRLRVVKEGE